jgi:hypothetical protein
MHFITLKDETDFDGWRKAARALAVTDVDPADVTWTVQGNEADLFAPPSPMPLPEKRTAPSSFRQSSSTWPNPRSCIAIPSVLRCSIVCSGG